jgi:hypothetical protein
LLPSVRGDLLAKLGRHDEAQQEFLRAASLTRNARERTLLPDRAEIARLSSRLTRDRVHDTADLTLQEKERGDSLRTYQASIPFSARRLSVRMICG